MVCRAASTLPAHAIALGFVEVAHLYLMRRYVRCGYNVDLWYDNIAINCTVGSLRALLYARRGCWRYYLSFWLDDSPLLPARMKLFPRMKKFLLIAFTTCIVGFGVWFALFFVAGVFTLFGEGDYGRFHALSIIAILVGIITALFWVWRRIRSTSIKFPEWLLFVCATLSLLGLAQHVIADEAREFLAFDPLVAAQRDSPFKPEDHLSFLGTTSMGVREYLLERGGKPWWAVGVFPRYRLWWTNAYSMDLEDYERLEQKGTLDEPRK